MDQTRDFGNESYQRPNSSPQDRANQETQQSITIPVIEERVQVGKQVVEKGAVRLVKMVTEQEVPVNIPLTQEEHDIQRVPVNEYVDSPPPPIRYEGDTMIIPIVQEVMVVQKRLMVVEELHITKNRVQTNDVQQVSLRKEEIRVERISADHADGSAS
ncbi:YsnF/AvaK domain-containing protein [Rufibacter sediminis]|uniref:YsnF/AvaK domain-containing protein n=1 Tax=Rufibacter sediminis TaxID=2762756 RepID=A0ABR6VW33_9BACT|nr:YsnF/AvaK domain-containing protein [Rufibacter sediminis]MBC3541134.1 YsnF/AvaK domain-containing protein [Rufibacter sediminis]